jgi:hypothetical protein
VTEAATDYVAVAGGELGGHLFAKASTKYGLIKEGREARESQRQAAALEERLRRQNPARLDKIHSPAEATYADALKSAHRKGFDSAVPGLFEDIAALGLGRGSLFGETVAASATAAGIEYAKPWRAGR